MRVISALILGLGLISLQGCCTCFLGKICHFTPSSEKAAAEKARALPSDLSRQAKDLSQVADTTQTANGILVKLKGDVLFKKGKNELSDDASKKLMDIASVLKKYPKTRITVIGHTDNTGKKEDNLALSRKRAAAVKAGLVKGGVPSGSVKVEGKGDTEPVAPNDNPENQAKNRRAELKIEPIQQ